MTSEKPLDDLYQLYRKGDLARKDFEGKVFKYLLGNCDKFGVFGRDTDSWNEFLGWFYLRLSRAIDLYHELGSSFDAYIACLVRNSSKQYRQREAEHYTAEYTCWQARNEDNFLREFEPDYSVKGEFFSLPDGINPKQILFLLLKSYHSVTDEFVERTAAAIGIESGRIWEMINKIKEMHYKKEAEMSAFRERLFCQHYRCLVYQKRMNDSLDGTLYHDKMKSRYERARKRFNRMRKRFRGIKMAASNRMIADILGVPKGTVDSGISILKSRFSS